MRMILRRGLATLLLLLAFPLHAWLASHTCFKGEGRPIPTTPRGAR